MSDPTNDNYNSPPKPKFEYVDEEKINENLKCIYICHQPLVEPVEHDNCGNSFCSDCISKCNHKCPVCDTKNINEYKKIKNKAFLNQLHELKIKCNNCDKLLKREDFSNHTNICEFGCPRNCGININRNTFIEHDSKCKNKLKLCDNNCGVYVLDKNIFEHLNICPNKVIECCAFYLGCKNSFCLKELDNHNKICDKYKLHIILQDLNEKYNRLCDENNKLKQHIITLENNIGNISNKLEDILPKNNNDKKGCGVNCEGSHDNNSICLICGKTWSSYHAGHTCKNGVRGSF